MPKAPLQLPPVQLPESAAEAPTGDRWIHEVKVDGYRMLCRREGDKLRLVSRHGVDWTQRFRSVLPELGRLPAKQLILDGEITVLEADGSTRFSKLQGNRQPQDLLVYYVFDVLHQDGHDLRRLPLTERKQVLTELLKKESHPSPLQRVEHFECDGPMFFRRVVDLGLEGVVSKLKAGPYRSTKNRDWLKTKNKHTAAFVVVGYETQVPDVGFRLLLGYFHENGKLVLAGNCDLGFTRDELAQLKHRLRDVALDQCPVPGYRGRRRRIHWVRPELVVAIEMGAWKGAGFLREPVYRGLRADVPAESVVAG